MLVFLVQYHCKAFCSSYSVGHVDEPVGPTEYVSNKLMSGRVIQKRAYSFH
jgi:hypothetical protein